MRFLPAGPSAVLVELKDLDEVFSLTAEIDRHRQHGWGSTVVDVVPGAATVLLDGVEDPAAVASEIETWPMPELNGGPVTTVEISCRYDGPDLVDVAKFWGVTEMEVVENPHLTLPSGRLLRLRPGFCLHRRPG